MVFASSQRSAEVLAALPGPFQDRVFIDGEWLAPKSGGSQVLVSQFDGRPVGKAPASGPADMDAAVLAARHAFERGNWSRRSFAERAQVLAAIAAQLRQHQQLAGDLWTAQVAAPVGFANYLIGQAAEVFDYYAGLGASMDQPELHTFATGGTARVWREPMGVAAIITPWNAPLILLCYSAAAALLAGCSVVSKPSPESPLDGLLLAHCAQLAGLPPGVLNVVPGDAVAGEHLVRHPEVNKISFTGSTAAGQRVGMLAAERVARCTLELGGKSAAILLDDADLDAALKHIVPMSMPFSGQICFALTRILVPHSRAGEILEAYTDAVRALQVGDPWDPQTQVGPVVSARQQQRIQGYIQAGKASGARVVLGGGAVDAYPHGFFVQPTVFADVPEDASIAQEEIFGPVVCVQGYEDDADAIRIANSTPYGLNGAVFSADVERGLRMVREVRTGSSGLNLFDVRPEVPTGGFGQSGIGRVGGLEGLRAFQEPKSVYLPR